MTDDDQLRLIRNDAVGEDQRIVHDIHQAMMDDDANDENLRRNDDADEDDGGTGTPPRLLHRIPAPQFQQEPDQIPVPIETSTPRRTSLELTARIKRAVQALGAPLTLWKRALGLEPCHYYMPMSPLEVPSPCPRLAMCCSPAPVTIYTALVLVGVVLQWFRCNHKYLVTSVIDAGYIMGNHSGGYHGNYTEYVCEHSFVWVYLLPNFINLGGFLIFFVSWYCLRHTDLSNLAYTVHNLISQEDAYEKISTSFLQYCRRDRVKILVAFLATLVLIAVSILVGDGVVFGRIRTPAESRYVYTVLGELCDLVVSTMTYLALTYCLVGHLLSLKYFELALEKVLVHLQAVGVSSHMTARHFTVDAFEQLSYCINKSQVTLTTGILMTVLALSRALSVIAIDIQQKPPRFNGIGHLPLPLLMFSYIVMHLILGLRLVSKGYRCHTRCVPVPATEPSAPQSAQLSPTRPMVTPPPSARTPSPLPPVLRPDGDHDLESGPAVAIPTITVRADAAVDGLRVESEEAGRSVGEVSREGSKTSERSRGESSAAAEEVSGEANGLAAETSGTENGLAAEKSGSSKEASEGSRRGSGANLAESVQAEHQQQQQQRQQQLEQPLENGAISSRETSPAPLGTNSGSSSSVRLQLTPRSADRQAATPPIAGGRRQSITPPVPLYEGASALQRRAEEEWRTALATAPLVTARVAGTHVAPWMFSGLAAFLTLSTIGMYWIQVAVPVI